MCALVVCTVAVASLVWDSTLPRGAYPRTMARVLLPAFAVPFVASVFTVTLTPAAWYVTWLLVAAAGVAVEAAALRSMQVMWGRDLITAAVAFAIGMLAFQPRWMLAGGAAALFAFLMSGLARAILGASLSPTDA